MKKLIYSLALVLMGLTSCTSFDDPTTENYGAGPAVDVNLTAAIPTDSAFTITITPAAGSVYYAYAIDENDEAVEIDGYSLLKGSYGNTVLKVADKPTLTLDIDDADPNTTYQVYAVAANDKGIIGDVVVKSITTSDGLAPSPRSIAKDADNAAIQLIFSEALVRGNGAVTAQYYKEWDILNPVDVPAEDILVEVEKNAVVFAAANIPAGAYLCFSYAAGAFKDSKGNDCGALNSGLNMNTGKFVGAWVQKTNESFEISDEYVTAPADGALIGKVEDFKGEITFPFNIYRNDQYVETGDLSVTFTNAAREATYKLSADEWSVKDSILTFVLPATAKPEGGDIITFNVVEGAVSDVYGNPNKEFSSAISWKFFAPTKDMVLGTFDFAYYSAYDEEPQLYNGGPITISENAEKENGLIIKGLFSDYIEGTELEGSYNLSSGKLYIDAYQILGKFTNSKGTVYGLVLYSQTYQDQIEFTINADGTITSSDLGIVAYDENYEEALGWMEKASVATFIPKAEAARSLKKVSSNTKKLNARVRNLKKHVSK